MPQVSKHCNKTVYPLVPLKLLTQIIRAGSNPGSSPSLESFRFWHIAKSFRNAKFGRYRGMPDMTSQFSAPSGRE
jgi:hypothetical protein